MTQDLQMFTFESNQELIESKKPNYRLHETLTQIDFESGKRVWTQDELESF